MQEVKLCKKLRTYRQRIQTRTRFDVELFVSRSPVTCPSLLSSQLRYPKPVLILVIHNYINALIFLCPETLPICGTVYEPLGVHGYGEA